MLKRLKGHEKQTNEAKKTDFSAKSGIYLDNESDEECNVEEVLGGPQVSSIFSSSVK